MYRLQTQFLCAMIKSSVSSQLQQTSAFLVVGLNPENKPGYRELRAPEATEPKRRFLLSVASADPAPACIGGMEIDRLSTHPEACRRELSSGIANKVFGQAVRQPNIEATMTTIGYGATSAIQISVVRSE